MKLFQQRTPQKAIKQILIICIILTIAILITQTMLDKQCSYSNTTT